MIRPDQQLPNKPPDGSVLLNDFAGLINNVDSRDLPTGGSDLITNAACLKMGQLQIRLGTRDVTFEADL